MKLHFRTLAALALGSLLTACVTPPAEPPFAVHSPVPMEKTELTKTFVMNHDWSHDGWVMKRGSMINFNADGTGVMEITVYEEAMPPRRSRLHFFSEQFGPDGNGLFKLPNSDGGQILHLHGVRKDCISTVPFAYDARYFPSITRVNFRVGRDVPLGITTPPPSYK
jgi:hypothetical protein